MIKELKQETLKLRKARSPIAPTMQFHIAEVDKIGKAKQRNTTEDEATQYIKKTVQKLKEAPTSNNDEITVLESLLPQMASEQEVKEFLSTIDTTNKGVVMKAVKAHFGVNVDMKMVSKLL